MPKKAILIRKHYSITSEDAKKETYTIFSYNRRKKPKDDSQKKEDEVAGERLSKKE